MSDGRAHWSDPTELLTLRMAASRSCQSERLTNSNRASLTSCASAFEDPVRRFLDEDPGRWNGSSISSEGVDADCLKSWSESATLRPIPAWLWLGERFCDEPATGESEDDAEPMEDCDERRDLRRTGEEGGDGLEDEEGRVSARTGRRRSERRVEVGERSGPGGIEDERVGTLESSADARLVEAMDAKESCVVRLEDDERRRRRLGGCSGDARPSMLIVA